MSDIPSAIKRQLCKPLQTILQLDLWAVAEDVEAFSTVIARPTVAVKCAVASFSSEAVY